MNIGSFKMVANQPWRFDRRYKLWETSTLEGARLVFAMSPDTLCVVYQEEETEDLHKLPDPVPNRYNDLPLEATR